MRSEGRPRSVTMADVAKHAGVSRALVSIVLRDAPGASPAMREHIRRSAAALDYRPDQRARLLGSNRSRTLGVAFGLHHEFHAELVEALYLAGDRSGYDLALGPFAPSRAERTAVQSLLEFRCEALILIGSSLPRAHVEELARRVPLVLLARSLRSTMVDIVRTDDVLGARMAVEHLVQLGHRRIAHIDGHRAPGAAERRRGYRDAMRAAGLSAEIRFVRGGLTEEDGERAGCELLGGHSIPTAVLAFNDHCAAGLLATARGRSIDVPADLSIVGYDNSHVAHLSTIALTTVAQDGTTMAGSAIERASGWAEADLGRHTETVVAPQFIVRRTTARPADRAIRS